MKKSAKKSVVKKTLKKSVKKQAAKKTIKKPVAKKSMKKKSSDKSRGCTRQSTKKYEDRPSPPFPANECCNQEMMGNDGNMYVSRADKNGRCAWKKVN